MISTAKTRSLLVAASFAAITLAGVAPTLAVPPGGGIFRLTAAQFVSNCQAMGGTTSPVSSAAGTSIRCVLPSGLTVDCSFSGDQAVCQWSRATPVNSLKDLLGDSPQSMNPDSPPPESLTSSGSETSPGVVGGGTGSGKGAYAGGAGDGSSTLGGGGPVVK